MKVISAVAVTLMAFASIANAQDLSKGRYTGSYPQRTASGERPVGLVLVIDNVQAGVVTATATTTFQAHGAGSPPCSGEYQMEGKYTDNKLRLRSKSTTARGSDCRLSLNLSANGDKLVGTTGGGAPVNLSK